MRRPRLAKVFGLTDLDVEHSFSHTLQRGGKCNFSELVNRSCIEDLDVIASLKPEGVDPASIMGSSIVSEFFAWARENYDRVIIDSPPFGIVGDVVTLASMVDGVMVVCCPDRTHFRPIQSAVRNLAEAGATVLGVIVNDVETNQMDGAFSMHGHYSYGYGGYSYGYKPEAKAAAVSAEASKTVTDEE